MVMSQVICMVRVTAALSPWNRVRRACLLAPVPWAGMHKTCRVEVYRRPLLFMVFVVPLGLKMNRSKVFSQKKEA